MWLRLRIGIVCGIVLGFAAYFFFFSPPSSFPSNILLPVTQGETGSDIARSLKSQNAIRSEFFFRVLLRVSGAQSHIVAGTYYFPHPQNAFTIAWRLGVGHFEIDPIKVTIPEGTDVRHISALLQQSLPAFDSKAFLTLATPYEGYLYPDTYFLYPGEGVEEIIEVMRNNFDIHMKDPNVKTAIAASGRTTSDLVVMASLIEKEAPDTKNRQIISGILWKRLSLRMPLQVDAVFPYITGKNGKDILQSDYAIDSPYNTYIHLGLPPGPITNPSIDAIIAAATPTSTPYLYYLSDRDGVFHYSATFEQQLANQRKYLR